MVANFDQNPAQLLVDEVRKEAAVFPTSKVWAQRFHWLFSRCTMIRPDAAVPECCS